jgi:ferredoxin
MEGGPIAHGGFSTDKGNPQGIHLCPLPIVASGKLSTGMAYSNVPVYNITLVGGNEGTHVTIKVGGDEYILESAQDQGIQLPASCNAGKCITCVSRLLEGEVDRDDIFLRPQEMAAGFILTCKSYPRSDCVILTHQEDALLDLEV